MGLVPEESGTSEGKLGLEAARRGEGDAPVVLDALGKVLIEISKEMAPVVSTTERLERLEVDLKAYRSALWDAGETEASRYAHAVYAVFHGEDRPTEHPFLVALCFTTLRAALIEMSEVARQERLQQENNG